MIQDNLKQRLEVLRGTLRNACTLDGAGRLVLALVICILAGVALDYFFFRWDRPVNTFFRVLMTAGILGTLGTIAYRRIFMPLSVPLSIDDMALSVEKEFPQLNDSLISTIQLTRMLADDRTISAPMVEEVSRSAYQQTAALDFARVVKFDRIRPVLYSAGGSVALLLILCAIPALRPFMGTGMLRLLNPLSKYAYPVRTFIEVSVDGKRGPEKIVPRNDSTSIVAEVRGELPSQAYIAFDYGKGFGKAEPITGKTKSSDQNGEKLKEFQYDYNPVISSFSFIIKAGDNEAGPFKVRAVDRPELVNMTVTYKLPDYISDKEGEPRRERSLRNVVGTQAKLAGEFNKPMKPLGALIKVGNAEAVPMALSQDRTKFLHTLTLDETKDYEIFLHDEDELDNKQSKIRHKIFVLPDNLPRVSWRQPAMDLEVSPTATVVLNLGLEDDYGLKKSGIKFKRFKGTTPVKAPDVAGARNAAPATVDTTSPGVEGGFELPEPQPGAYNRSAQKLDLTKDWSLADMGLEPGDVVEYWAEAYDYCPAARKPAEPQIFRLRILSPEEIRRKLDIDRLRLIEDLKVIIRDQENDRKQVDSIKDHLAVGNPFANTDRAKVSEAGALQEEVRRKTHSLQNAFDNLIQRYISNGLDTPDDKDRLQQIRDVLEVEHIKKMPEAAREITSSAMAKADDDRITNLKNAIKKQDEILSDLKALLEQMQKWAETEDLLRMTRELLLKQRNVTKLTSEFKDRLGSKKPSEATKEEQGQVKGLEHEQRDCATDMQALFQRMLQAQAKMAALDKWVATNIEAAINIAQNTDASPDKPDQSTTGDPYPGIEDKMRAAQNDIRETFSFGTAGAKQKNAEGGLERIITVLSRRRDVDKEMMKDIEQASRDMKKILDQQRDLIKKTDNIQDKKTLEQNIAQAKQQLQDLREKQSKLKDETQKFQNQSDPKAAGLEQQLASAAKELDDVIKQQNKIFKDTVDQLSPAEREIARSLHELEEIEMQERALAKESNELADPKAEKALREQFEKVKKLRTAQKDIESKITMANSAPDQAKAAEALKALQDGQSKLRTETITTLGGLNGVAEELTKGVAKDSPRMTVLQPVVRALTQAASLGLHAPEEMKKAAELLGDAKGKESFAASLDAIDKLIRTEEVLLKALGFEHKRFEETAIDIANRQADTRGKLDEIANRIANLIRAGNTPEQVEKDKKLAPAGKDAARALPELEGSSKDMSDAADVIRQGAPSGNRVNTGKASAMQISAADKIKKAREILQGTSEELSKDKKSDHDKVGAQQTEIQNKAKALQTQIENLAKEIENAHAAASGDQPRPADPAGAAGKIGEAANNMSDATKDLSKPNPAGATKNESKAIDALEEAKEKMGDLRRKVEELKEPGRRLERMQKELKDKARKLATDVKGIEDQLPMEKKDSKPGENIKNASNSMQNAQNSMSGDNAGPDGKQGNPDNKEAAKEQENAISELDKALKALDDLAAKAAKEQDPRAPSVLDRLKQPQNALRDEVLKLQKKLDQFRDKTGNKNAEKASQANQSASKNQSAASSQMGQGNQSGAKSSEEEAEQDLQDALENLEQFQQQMQQQNKNEQLFQIEQELKKMLTVQKDLLGKTQDVEKQRPGPDEKLPRRAKGMVKQVFEDQQKLADAGKQVVKKLEEAPVFQYVMQGASNDMAEAAARLDKEESGVLTQEMQEDVIRNLGDLIEALRKERQNPQQGGGGGGGGGGKQPLVPPLAELKMLRIMQRNVNGQTKKIDEEVSKAKDSRKELTKDQKDRLRRAAVKEGEIARVTKRIADELSGGGAAPPIGPEEKDEDK
ncbi:MAG TPA: hypothetical protein VEK08_06020 [Planctomycetota bacterium]|nr:hypothetical protein [Planctomycetota bacterium]